jgi:uncharacterized protein (TIGR02284 family)
MLSDDTRVLEDLIETLEDGREGFKQAAEKLEDDGHSEIAAQMMEFSDQRARFSSELRQLASGRGTEIKESGSAAGALHRGWMSLKDALTGDDPHAVLSAAETGEDHAVSEYEDAVEDEALPSEFRDVVRKQAAEVRRAHDTVRALRDRFAD